MLILPYSYAPLTYEWTTGNECTDIVYIHKREFIRYTGRNDTDGDGLFAVIVGDGMEEGVPVRIGGFHMEEVDVIYGPSWIIEALGGAVGEINDVSMQAIDNIETATQIQLILMEDAALIYGPETKELFENAITRYGCIKRDSVIKLWLDGLDIVAEAFVSMVEPAAIARFNGEVEVDIVGDTMEEPIKKTNESSIPVIPHNILEKLAANVDTIDTVIEKSIIEEAVAVPTMDERRAAIRAAWAKK